VEVSVALRVWTDGTDWVIAETAERAWQLAHDAVGAKPGEMGDVDDWKPLADDTRLRVHDQRDDSVLTLAAAEWVAREGKEAFLCSTEL
jgi:hypothetical protein